MDGVIRVRRKSLDFIKRNNKIFAISLIAIVGGIVVFSGIAAVPYASLETEAGSLSSRAVTVADAMASGGQAVKFDTALTGPIPMQMISLNKPAYASSGTASNANDNNYNSAWSPGGSGWLAYDLSSVPANNRQSVVLAWFTNPDDGWSVSGYQGSCAVWSGRPYLSNYTVQINGAAGGGSAPTSGWQTIATVSGNTNLSGQHLVNMAGSNWIRINGSGPNGININVDVADASNGLTDGWLFLGDSITAAYGGHFTNNDQTGTSRGSITELISQKTTDEYRSIQMNGGMACTKSYDATVWIDELLDGFHGRYVTLNFGTNDSWAGSGDPAGYKSTMQGLIDKVTARGMTPVIATIPWPNNGGGWEAQVAAFNSKILELYNENPEVIPGPDLYSLSYGKPSLYNGAGDVHFNGTGGAMARNAWAESAKTNIYGY